jgi:hypothetical protein
MRSSVGFEKQRLLNSLKDFEESAKESASAESLAQWLREGGVIR